MGLIHAPHVSIAIAIEDPSGVGEARRRAVELAEAMQLSQGEIGRIALVVTEAATNILHYAQRGEILLRSFARSVPSCLEMIALDRGPGIANVAAAMRDGFSTGNSAGLGLGAISRMASVCEISSTPGKGTALLARIGRLVSKRPDDGGLTWGVVCVAKQGQDVCGDGWAVASGDGGNTVLVVDGLGHGPPAFDAARRVLEAFRTLAPARVEVRLQQLHETMRVNATHRGAVAALAEIDWRRRRVSYAGAGNIAGTLVPVDGPVACLVSQPGTLGQQVTRFQEFDYRWPEQGLLVLHSDGLSDRWLLEPYPGLTRKDPALIAGVLYRDFANRRDDVVVLVGCERAAIARAV